MCLFRRFGRTSEQILYKCIWYFIIELFLLVQCTTQTVYSRIHATRSPASDEGNVSESKLMSHIGGCAKSCARRSVCSCSQSGGRASFRPLLTYQGDRRKATVRFVRLALKVVTQNDGDFVDVFLLFSYHPGFVLSSFWC